MRFEVLLISLFVGILLNASVVQSGKRHRLHFPRHAALSVKEPGWGLDADGNVFALNAANQLVKVPGKTLTYVDVGVFYGELHAFGIDKYLDVYQRVGEKGKWTYLPGKKLRYLRIQGPNRIWGLNSENQIFTFNLTTHYWKKIPGTLKYLDVHPTGRIWGIGLQNQVYTRDPNGGNLVLIDGTFNKLRVVRNGQVFAMDESKLFWREGVQGQWTQEVGYWLNFDINNKLDLFGIGSDYTVWHHDIARQIFTKLEGFSTRIRVFESGRIFGIDERNKKVFTNEGTLKPLTEVSGASLVALFGPDFRK